MESSGYEGAVQRWCESLRDAAARLAYRILPGLSLAPLEVAAARLAPATIPQLFSINLRQIDPSLNEDLLDLYGASEQILSNNFTFLNRSKQFQSHIDWELRESEAWLGELHAFDYALNLALTYRISGEGSYARHLRHLIAHWIAENPPPRGTGWRPASLARRVRNWILAADLARADWEQDREFLPIVSRSLALQCALLARQSCSAGFSLLALDQARALLLAGKVFTGRGGAGLETAAFELTLRVLESVLSLEDDFEASLAFRLGLVATILECLLFAGERKEAEALKEGLREILATLEGILLPDQSLPLFGPAARADFTDLAALAAVVLRDPTWKALAGKFGIWPYMLLGEEGKMRFAELPGKAWQAGNRFMPREGLYRLCGENSSALIINGQALSSPGAHADRLTFELSIQGHRVIVDSGAQALGSESEEKYFSTALAHNVFLLDDRLPRGSALLPHQAPPEDWESGPGFTGLSSQEQTLLSGRLQYQRAWYCLDGRYWVIFDRLEGQGCHSGTSLLHFYPTFEVQLLSDRAVARSRALAVTIIPFGTSRAQMMVSQGEAAEFPGWYAPSLGIKYPGSVLALRWKALELPWVGGQLILPGEEAAFRAETPDRQTGAISVELYGKIYRLPLPAR